MKDVADRALERLPQLQKVLVVNRLGEAVAWQEGRDHWWHDLVANASTAFTTVRTAADDHCMILYTSGTTGRPKGAVHIHAGFPLKATHDMAYCFDVQRDDTVFWLTDMGWMMGPWLVCGGLTLGAAIVLLEGTPDYPGPDRLWKMVERHRITVLGLAPTAIRALMPSGSGIVEATDRSSLRVLGSTGETWNPDPWWWYFSVVGDGACPIINYSGGTETSGGIVSGFTITPLKPCSFAGAVPGMVADVVDDAGEPVREGVGELIVREPWVGMTNGIWHDPDRYLETYWSRFPDVWVHGDYAEIDADGFWYIRGRSDDTLKVAGKRIGPAEVESAAVAHPLVREAAAIGVPDAKKGDVVVVFAIAVPGAEMDTRLCHRGLPVYRHPAGIGPATRARGFRQRPAPHPQCQDHAPGRARRLAGAATRRAFRSWRNPACHRRNRPPPRDGRYVGVIATGRSVGVALPALGFVLIA
jgi:acetyl-CoA synthetase